jgi:putative ABC transport system ATP-binding protein
MSSLPLSPPTSLRPERHDTRTAPTAAAELRSVSKTFGAGAQQVRALQDVSVSFAPGVFTAIMGPSGSGKSTLLNVLAGLDRVDRGEVLIGGVEITRLDDRALTRLRRQRLGFVFQSFNLMPALSAFENIVLPSDLDHRAVDQDELGALVRSLGIADRLGHRPAELSGGQQQRVAIARALLGRPDLVVCDEPTGALDSVSGAEVLSALRVACTERRQTVVMVTHDPAAASCADRVLVVRDGRIVDQLDDPSLDRVMAALADRGAVAS